jgi:hypothetical protein
MYITKLEFIVLCFVISIHTYHYVSNKETLYRTIFRKVMYFLMVFINLVILFLRWLP